MEFSDVSGKLVDVALSIGLDQAGIRLEFPGIFHGHDIISAVDGLSRLYDTLSGEYTMSNSEGSVQIAFKVVDGEVQVRVVLQTFSLDDEHNLMPECPIDMRIGVLWTEPVLMLRFVDGLKGVLRESGISTASPWDEP